MNALLSVAHLSVGYPGPGGSVASVLADVSLTLERGASLGIVGESGCGKSTLALALLGFLRPGGRLLDGAVRLGDEDMFALSPADLQRVRGRRVALVPQSAAQALTPSLHVGSQIAESVEIHRGLGRSDAQAAALELLRQVRLPRPEELARRYPHQLSGGQQQRVAIAMALAGGPELLILDEPTTGLDVTTQAHILDLLDEIRARTGAAMVYVSHDLGVIARVSEHLAVMYAGQVVEHGPTNRLFAHPRHPYTRGLLASVPRLDTPVIPLGMAGQPPTPGPRTPGCAFAPRCLLATPRCLAEGPLLQPSDRHEHLVRCHNWQEPTMLAGPPPRQDRGQHHSLPTLVTLSDVSITYARRGLMNLTGLRRVTPAPPTVDQITLAIHRGETLALVGESGSGKSTLARAVAGLQPVRGGELRLGDADLRLPVQRRPAELRRAIQLVFQNPDASLNPRQTVGQIVGRPLQIFFGLQQAERKARVVDLLEQMRLGAHYLERFPGQLSGGEKQRVAIARAFAAEPDLVLCDEVVSALDVSVQAVVLDLLVSLRAERGATYLFISHDLAVVRAIADRVAVLYQGRLCELGPVAAVYSPPYHPYTESLLAAAPEPVPGKRPRRLSGDITVSGPPAHGCPFQSRCPRRIGPICDEEAPPWRSVGNGHHIRCHLPVAELHITLEATGALEARETPRRYHEDREDREVKREHRNIYE